MSGDNTTLQNETAQTAQTATTLAQMPALGLVGLALELYPGDRDDQAKIAQHVADLFALNSDLLRNDTTHTVGQLVRIPAEV